MTTQPSSTRRIALTPAIMDRRSPDDLRAMAATARMVLDGGLIYRATPSEPKGRPLPPRYSMALDLVDAGLV